MTQRERVLALLKAGRCLSAIDALRLVGTNRLAARVFELREAGHDIRRRLVRVRTRDGHARIAIYYLAHAA